MAPAPRSGECAARQAPPHVPGGDGLGGLPSSRLRDRRRALRHAVDEYPKGELDEKAFTVVTAVGANERFTYEYDFGDSWQHEITVHRVGRMAKGLKFAVCLDGANACPPEDVGGSWGYEHRLAVLGSLARGVPAPQRVGRSACRAGGVRPGVRELLPSSRSLILGGRVTSEVVQIRWRPCE